MLGPKVFNSGIYAGNLVISVGVFRRFLVLGGRFARQLGRRHFTRTPRKARRYLGDEGGGGFGG